MRQLLLFLAGLAAFLATPALGHEREDRAPRTVAVGDLHGDFEAWETIAEAAQLVDRKGRWSGGSTVLVQLGDITDRGPDSLKIIRHLQALAEQAAKEGGQVIVLLGNHEAMNVTGDLRYVHAGEYEAFRGRTSKSLRQKVWEARKDQLAAAYREDEPDLTLEQVKQRFFDLTPLGLVEHRIAWTPDGELGKWAASLPAIARVGDTLFVHGGMSAERGLDDIAAINARYSAALLPGDLVDRSVLDDPLGPLWYRGNVVREAATPEQIPPRPSRAEELDAILAYHRAKRLVVGHTPSLQGMAAELGGRLVRVDTGIAGHYGGPASYLVIEDGQATAHQKGSDGRWTARALPLAHKEGATP